MRRFAEDTAIPVARTRGEIDALLRGWGCSAIAWGDDFEQGRVELNFRWTRDEQIYLARFAVALPTEQRLREAARFGGSGKVMPRKLQRLKETRGRWEHRVLLLWLKAALNAVEAGIVDPAVIFLPFLVGRNGQTFAEVALPRLPELLTGNAIRLLPGASD